MCSVLSYASARNNKSTTTADTVLSGAQIAATNSAQLATANAAECATTTGSSQCVSNTTPVPTATIDASIPTSTPAPAPKWTTTHKFTGSGDKQTAVFSVPDDWKINWSCDARNTYGVGGVFYIEVYNSDGTMSDAGDVSGNCSPSKITADSTEEHQSGDVYLKVITGVPWTIEVQEFK
jgi:hypothetical protein